MFRTGTIGEGGIEPPLGGIRGVDPPAILNALQPSFKDNENIVRSASASAKRGTLMDLHHPAYASRRPRFDRVLIEPDN